MLRTNSKKARENIRKYIVNGADFTGYDVETPETFPELAALILDTFRGEKPYSDAYAARHGMNEQAVFADWAAGLPSCLDCCYHYNRSAVDDLGAILEETDEEKNRYSEYNAERMLDYLIYRELTAGAARAKKGA